MPLAPPITDIEQLKPHPALARLVEWNASVVQAVKFDRDELTIWVEKDAIREVCAILRELKMFGFWEMMVYIAIVLVGLFYIWKKGALDWGLTTAKRGDF